MELSWEGALVSTWNLGGRELHCLGKFFTRRRPWISWVVCSWHSLAAAFCTRNKIIVNCDQLTWQQAKILVHSVECRWHVVEFSWVKLSQSRSNLQFCKLQPALTMKRVPAWNEEIVLVPCYVAMLFLQLHLNMDSSGTTRLPMCLYRMNCKVCGLLIWIEGTCQPRWPRSQIVL